MTLLEINIEDIQVAVTFISAIGILWLLAEFMRMKDAIKARAGINNETIKLQLQAYERLTLFAERAGLRNMVDREQPTPENAAIYHQQLVAGLKQEYEYNASQQIYVTPEIWNAVTKLKEQNIFILNQLVGNLPDTAMAADLAKLILQYNATANAELNSIVLDAIQFEAKKLM